MAFYVLLATVAILVSIPFILTLRERLLLFKNSPSPEKNLTHRRKWSLLSSGIVAGIILVSFSSMVVLLLTTNRPVQESYIIQSVHSSPTPVPARSGLPVNLKIPEINVDAAIESVGLTKQGEMGVPKGHFSTAWFNLGPRPGENGNAVIDGHFGIWDNNAPAVFNNLHKLRIGDMVYVENDQGKTITFVVRELRTYKPDQNASDVFGLGDGLSHLNLVTCGGTWNETTQSFPNRLVVFTDLVP